MNKNLGDICLHAMAAALMTGIAAGSAAGLVLVITCLWLMRELVQQDPHDMIAALRTMPGWNFRRHMEWLAAGVAAIAVIAIQEATRLWLGAGGT